jgi:class 3 adenylate cyclase
MRYTGKIESREDDVGGIAVHLAARIMAAAEPDEILVSSTVKDLVIGSDITFQDRGTHSLNGIEDPRQWRSTPSSRSGSLLGAQQAPHNAQIRPRNTCSQGIGILPVVA